MERNQKIAIGAAIALLAIGGIWYFRRKKHNFKILPTGPEKLVVVNGQDKGTLIFSPVDEHQIQELNQGIAFMFIDTTNKTAEALAQTSGETIKLNYKTRKFIS